MVKFKIKFIIYEVKLEIKICCNKRRINSGKNKSKCIPENMNVHVFMLV